MTLLGLETFVAGPLPLPEYEGWPATVHELSDKEILAIRTALAAGRPLLVRGEPGTGKTQLARAAAVALGRHYVSEALDAHTEARELFWTLDAVRRLSEAQVLAATASARIANPRAGAGGEPLDLRAELAEQRFVEPGVLWWAFDWDGAAKQQIACRGGQARVAAPWLKEGRGTVVLLDEIDKADPTLPNALLEALGVGRFGGPVGGAAIAKTGPEPLVIITTNEERELPYAFMRRCALLDLQLPSEDGALTELLIRRGAQHAKTWSEADAPPGEPVLRRAAELLVADRRHYRSQDLPEPGQAEYLDLVKAVCCLATASDERLELLEKLKPFVLDKHARRGSIGLT